MPQVRFLVLLTTVVPVIFSVSVFTRYQIGSVSVFSVSIVPPFFVSFPPFFLERGAVLVKKGAIAPLLRKKGGDCPLFETEMY
jgi:hypothetical protein